MNPKIVEGKPLDCYVCGKKLIQNVSGEDYRIEIKCSRCGTTITIQMEADQIKAI